jgi:nucleotide-binding universal stress UspA family protein
VDDIQRTGDGLMENLYDGGVVVGHSGHRGADDAVLVAARLAARLHLPLHVVHVIAVEDFPVDPDSLTDEADARSIAKQQQVVEGLLAGYEGPWGRRVERGDPAEVLSRVADEVRAPLLVVGTHAESRAGLGLRLLGHRSVSRAAVGLGRHPVLVVPEGTAQDLDEVRFGEPPPKAGPAV